MAEREGFEPSVRVSTRTRGFQPRSFGHSDTSPRTPPTMLDPSFALVKQFAGVAAADCPIMRAVR